MTLPVDPSRLAVYFGVMAAMAVFPGPANLFAVAVGMSRGHRAALAGVAGMNGATLVWYAAAALGLGALVAAFPEAFRILRVLGALYLLWMARAALIDGAKAQGPSLADAAPSRSRPAFAQGFMVQIANPKIVLFFTAVLPPFIDLKRPFAAQMILFAVMTIALDGAAMAAYGLGGAAFARRMEDSRLRRGFAFATAALLVVAAGLVAASAVQA